LQTPRRFRNQTIVDWAKPRWVKATTVKNLSDPMTAISGNLQFHTDKQMKGQGPVN
jgi:hypothetical protein